jgi:hypothetical protein
MSGKTKTLLGLLLFNCFSAAGGDDLSQSDALPSRAESPGHDRRPARTATTGPRRPLRLVAEILVRHQVRVCRGGDHHGYLGWVSDCVVRPMLHH